MRQRPTSLWRHPGFVKLWAGQTVSMFGSMLTRIALPLTALLALGSSPLQQGYLQAAGAVPVLVAGLFAGAWVDRLRRRPVMIAADLARAALLLLVPAAAFAGRLAMWHLYGVAAMMAFCAAFFDAAYPAYLPTLVGRDRVVEGNAKLSGSAAVAEMSGFASAGLLVQYFSGPAALLFDAFSFVVSALSIAWIRAPEAPMPVGTARPGIRAEVADGLVLVWRDATLRALVACSATVAVAGGVFAAMYMLFAVRDLGLSPAAAGLIAACGGLGSLGGALGAGPALRRLGARTTLLLGFGLGGAFQCLVPLAHGTPFAAGLYLVVAQVAGDGLMTVALINDASLRQTLVSDRALGRVAAIANVLRVIALPVGALAGGIVGQLASPRAALAGGAVCFVLSAGWIAMAPFDRIR
jgi:hypothetical protein